MVVMVVADILKKIKNYFWNFIKNVVVVVVAVVVVVDILKKGKKEKTIFGIL
jgi:hypothetical protein